MRPYENPRPNCKDPFTDADRDVVAAAADAITRITTIPEDAIRITAYAGWVTLSGCVEGRSLKETVERIVRHIDGVRGVTNSIIVDSNPALAHR